MKKSCNAASCNRKVLAKGLCSMHWQRQHRHGDHNFSHRPANGTLIRFIENLVKNSPGDNCVLWPYWKDKKGYGMVDIDNRKRAAHRVALILLTGIDPPDLMALHGPCNNPSCVNPHSEHGMRWGTATENVADKVRDGTANRGERHGMSKLTKDEILEIRSDKRSTSDIARGYQISRSHVTCIKRNQTWSWL